MRIVTTRRISQAFFLVLFGWFCVVTTVGESWWQLRGWRVNWLLQLDPLVALGNILTTQRLYAGLGWALVTVVGTILLGRFFCGWGCPFGTIHQFVGWLGSRRKTVAARAALREYHRGQSIKYYLLIFLLTASAGSLISAFLRAPRSRPAAALVIVAACLAVVAVLAIRKVLANPKKAIAAGVILLGVWIGLSFFFSADALLVGSLQTGLLDPLPLVYRSVNLALLPILDAAGGLSASGRFYDGGFFIGGVFLAAVLANLLVPRFYCRFICPLGALFGVLGRFAIWRIGTSQDHCDDCLRCQADCEGACDPAGQIRISECILCMNCLDSCPRGLVGYRTARSAAGEITSPDISRRGVIISLLSGVAMVPLLRLGGKLGPLRRAKLIRPPGALDEEGFLARCIRCGQCMRICPTNVLQPAGLAAGFEALWTPVLNNRIGTSGCQLNCVACGDICPTSAIRPISLAEKLGTGPFAQAGPLKIGTAFVDRGRCLPWAMGIPCIVCQENCPVSPKAIFVREHFSTVRSGRFRVKNADALRVEIEGATMLPGAFATGDHYVKVAGIAGDRRLIAENSANAITVASARPWVSPPAPRSSIEVQVRLQQPYVDPARCTGCGICEHECPVSGARAIRITAENESRSEERSFLL